MFTYFPTKFQADMGLPMALMFLRNMLGAMVLHPALAHFMLEWPLGVRAAVLAVLGLLTGYAAAAERPARSADAIYAKVCAQCHETRVGPALLGRELPEVVVKLVVRRGMNGMPAFRPSEITDDELSALSHLVSTRPAIGDMR